MATVDARERQVRDGRVSYEDPVPLEVVRDLLALTRALYRTFRGMGTSYAPQLLKLRGIGSQLRIAVEKGERGKPGTLLNRAAWIIAEQAAQDLGQLVDAYLPAKALITATGARLRKRR